MLRTELPNLPLRQTNEKREDLEITLYSYTIVHIQLAVICNYIVTTALGIPLRTIIFMSVCNCLRWQLGLVFWAVFFGWVPSRDCVRMHSPLFACSVKIAQDFMCSCSENIYIYNIFCSCHLAVYLLCVGVCVFYSCFWANTNYGLRRVAEWRHRLRLAGANKSENIKFYVYHIKSKVGQCGINLIGVLKRLDNWWATLKQALRSWALTPFVTFFHL